MNHAQWTPEVQATWAKLESLQLDNSTHHNNNGAGCESARHAVFDFAARLAQENGWSRARTARVILEYKRFLLMAAHAGHPVTPSEAVDQAWHLHLVYTRSYWLHLCIEILGRPLHHDPTSGGLDESTKFQAQYQRTLESYRRLFGAEPPIDLWPNVEECFKPKLNRWVDVSRHWTLRKPAWLRRMRPLLGARTVLPAAAAAVFVLTLAGCSSLNVFDYKGEMFIQFYVAAYVCAFLVSLLIVRSARAERPERLSDEDLTDPYEIAFLGGGGRRMVDAALAALYARDLLKLDTPKNGNASIGAQVQRVDDMNLPFIEHQVWQALPTGGTTEVRHVRKALIPTTQAMQESLAERGLLFHPSRLSRLRWLAALPMLVMLGVGVAKLFVGISRDKPVMFLCFCLFFSVVVLLLRLAMMQKRTAAGQGMWHRLARRYRDRQRMPEQSGGFLDPGMATLAVALGGSAMLATPSYQPMHDAIHRQSLGSGGGCGSGGCGSSSGGGGCGGSSGCGGGGGCGGCGGGD